MKNLESFPIDLINYIGEFLVHDPETMASFSQTTRQWYIHFLKKRIKQIASKHGHTLPDKLLFKNIDDTNIRSLLEFYHIINEDLLKIICDLTNTKTRWQYRAEKLEKMLSINFNDVISNMETAESFSQENFLGHNPLILAELAICYRELNKHNKPDETIKQLESLTKIMFFTFAAVVASEGMNTIAFWLYIASTITCNMYLEKNKSSNNQEKIPAEKINSIIFFQRNLSHLYQAYENKWLSSCGVTPETKNYLYEIIDSIYHSTETENFILNNYKSINERLMLLVKKYGIEKTYSLQPSTPEVIAKTSHKKIKLLYSGQPLHDLLKGGKGIFKFLELYPFEKIKKLDRWLSILCSDESLAFYEKYPDKIFEPEVIARAGKSIFQLPVCIDKSNISKIKDWLIKSLSANPKISLNKWQLAQINQLRQDPCAKIPGLINCLSDSTSKEIAAIMKNDSLKDCVGYLGLCEHHEVILKPFLNDLETLKEILDNSILNTTLLFHQKFAEFLLQEFTTIDSVIKKAQRLQVLMGQTPNEMIEMKILKNCLDKYELVDLFEFLDKSLDVYKQFVQLLTAFWKWLATSKEKKINEAINFFGTVQKIIERTEFISFICQPNLIKKYFILAASLGWEYAFQLYRDKDLASLINYPQPLIQGLVANCKNTTVFKQRLNWLKDNNFFIQCPDHDSHSMYGLFLHFSIQMGLPSFHFQKLLREILGISIDSNLKKKLVILDNAFKDVFSDIENAFLTQFCYAFANFKDILEILTAKRDDAEEKTFVDYIGMLALTYTENQRDLNSSLNPWLFNENCYLKYTSDLKFDKEQFITLHAILAKVLCPADEADAVFVRKLLASLSVKQIKQLDALTNTQQQQTISLLEALCKCPHLKKMLPIENWAKTTSEKKEELWNYFVKNKEYMFKLYGQWRETPQTAKQSKLTSSNAFFLPPQPQPLMPQLSGKEKDFQKVAEELRAVLVKGLELLSTSKNSASLYNNMMGIAQRLTSSTSQLQPSETQLTQQQGEKRKREDSEDSEQRPTSPRHS